MSVYRSAFLPNIPAGTVLRLQPGQWGWGSTRPLVLEVRRVRTDLWSRVDAHELSDQGHATVWLDASVAGHAVQVLVAVEALLAVADAAR
ncbi:MAG: hypothetical protein V7603_5094 [Micromonosporaceae bacterium]